MYGFLCKILEIRARNQIDPVAKTITEIELVQNPNETLQELYDLIGCDLVELVQLDRDIIMVVDEEGKLKEIKGGFTFLGWGTVIAGTGIVLGGNNSKLKALQENLATFTRYAKCKIIVLWRFRCGNAE